MCRVSLETINMKTKIERRPNRWSVTILGNDPFDLPNAE